MTRIASLLATALLLVTGCTADVSSYVPTFDEAALTPAEIAELPPGADADHASITADLTAADDDVALYDDDAAEPTYDVAVTDDDTDPPAAAPVYHHAALLHWGLHPRASDALRSIGVTSGRIMQTIGNAPASAGYHAQDGTVNGQPYTAAVDLSVSGMSATQIRNFLEQLAKVGFAGWYRVDGHDGWSGVTHVHAVYANCYMKTQLRAQIRSWLVGRNGLVSNTIYTFHTFTAAAKAAVKAKFEASHEGTTNGGAGASARITTHGEALVEHTGASLASAHDGSVADGAWVTITCQATGSQVTGYYGTSKLWDKLASGGYVTDTYVYTGSDGRVAPDCN
jgi:hypothetical protein